MSETAITKLAELAREQGAYLPKPGHWAAKHPDVSVVAPRQLWLDFLAEVAGQEAARTPGVSRLPVGLRVEQISEGDAEKLFGAAGSTPDVVGRIRESRRMAARTPDVSRLLAAAKAILVDPRSSLTARSLRLAIAEFEAATKGAGE